MTNLQRRLRKLEAYLTDSTGLILRAYIRDDPE